LLQLGNQPLQLCPREFLAEPKHPACYVGHGGEPLRNLMGSCFGFGIERETSPPSSFLVKRDLPLRRTDGPIGRSPAKTAWLRRAGESSEPSAASRVCDERYAARP
jgi:hypothetical protein